MFMSMLFQALTNLSSSITPEQVHLYVPAIPHCLNKLWVKGEVNLHSLRLLVNLACCPDLVPYILASKVSTYEICKSGFCGRYCQFVNSKTA